MKKIKWTISLFCFICFHNGCGFSDATQNLTMTIPSTSNITTSGNPASLTVSLDSSGKGTVTDSSTTYTVTSNSQASGTLQIIGAITSGDNMPPNTCLSVLLQSNLGTSLGTVELCTTSAALVNQLQPPFTDTASITYTFSIKNGWTVPNQTLSRTVTFTLTSGS